MLAVCAVDSCEGLRPEWRLLKPFRATVNTNLRSGVQSSQVGLNALGEAQRCTAILIGKMVAADRTG